jgi:Tat protein translocase TatC
MAPQADESGSHSMSFVDHLMELRKRLLYALIGVAIACLVTYYYGFEIVAWLCVPLIYAQHAAGLPGQVYAFKVTTAFGLYMKVGLIAAFVASAPWVVYQLWRFIAAGLYASERRVVHLLAPLSAVMTLLGVLFFYYILLPLALMFLVGFASNYPTVPADRPLFVQRMMDTMPSWTRSMIDWMNGMPSRPMPPSNATSPAATQPLLARLETRQTDPANPYDGQVWLKLPENELRSYTAGSIRVWPATTTSIAATLIGLDEYIDFVLFTGLAVIITFQVPVVMVVLGWTGLVAPRTLAKARRYCIFACVVLAAVLTPTGDPFNLALLAVPMWLLYELGLILMRLSYRPRRATDDA